MALKPKRVLFWMHLITGVVCGLIVALLATTGGIYAFQGEIQAFARRDVARVIPAETPRVPLADILATVRKENPDTPPSGIVVHADPAAATQVMMGREKPSLYANPYTGEVKVDSAAKLSEGFAFVLRLHRWLAFGGENKKIGAAITGACATAFLFLSLSGLYLWWPRHLTRRTIRPSAWFIRGAKGRLRDWNWHNVFGFWSLPLLILLSSTGMAMSYRWAGNLLYVVVGETPPPPRNEAPRAPGDERSSEPRIEPPEPGMRPLGHDALLAVARKEAPDWASISFRMQGAGMGREVAEASRLRSKREDPRVTDPAGPRSEAGGAARAPDETRRPRGVAHVSIIIRHEGALPLTAVTTLTLNPYTGEVIKREGFAEKSLGNKFRGAVRPVHTGEAFGIPGQLLMFLAAVAALILVYTGFALSWRRFFPGKKTRHHQHRDDGKQPPVFESGHP